jgi:hypothetical integral membrane protein (TIGR02206 family)
MTDDLLHTFRPWSLSHWCVIVGTVVISVSLAAVRRRSRASAAAKRLDLCLGGLGVAAWIAVQTLQISLAQNPVRNALPLHVSDLTSLAVPIALLTQWRWMKAMVYYWGIVLGSLAFIMPDLHEGPARPAFWLFWLPHLIICAGIAYEVIGRDYRAGRRDFATIALISLAYAVVMVPLNVAAGSSYGYVGPDHPDQPAVLQHFGRWPLRVVPIVLTGLAAMAVLTRWRGERVSADSLP